ncbi:MAG: hypothetical protein HGA67_01290 [Candidatus Yonathbacteria bacterium]|nr:hypothetical protein [Candidatus Yonathbacteria bacterium]
MIEYDESIFTSDAYLQALQEGVMYRTCPIARVSFNDGDPDVYARCIGQNEDQIQAWMTPDGVQIMKAPSLVSLYYMRPFSEYCLRPWGEVVGKEPSKIKSIQFLN